jgi:hypothetical protein
VAFDNLSGFSAYFLSACGHATLQKEAGSFAVLFGSDHPILRPVTDLPSRLPQLGAA